MWKTLSTGSAQGSRGEFGPRVQLVARADSATLGACAGGGLCAAGRALWQQERRHNEQVRRVGRHVGALLYQVGCCYAGY